MCSEGQKFAWLNPEVATLEFKNNDRKQWANSEQFFSQEPKLVVTVKRAVNRDEAVGWGITAATVPLTASAMGLQQMF